MRWLRCTVISVGRIGRLYTQTYCQDPRCELVGVTDANAKAARSVADKVVSTAFPDADAVLDTEPDVVSVAVPEQKPR